jgi:protein TonB
VVRRLERLKKYPNSARHAGQQGQAMVVMTVTSGGHVQQARLTKSTGHQILDDEVMALTRRVDPLPAFPSELDRTEITLEVPVNFNLKR